eukprot:scaffold89149_cov21-Tisochrysis_lutea.AAC.6
MECERGFQCSGAAFGACAARHEAQPVSPPAHFCKVGCQMLPSLQRVGNGAKANTAAQYKCNDC